MRDKPLITLLAEAIEIAADHIPDHEFQFTDGRWRPLNVPLRAAAELIQEQHDEIAALQDQLARCRQAGGK